MDSTSNALPGWLTGLDEEDLQFLRRFLFASGSLKELATDYGISYPTVRGRLDRLIAKAKAGDGAQSGDEFDRHLRLLTADGAISVGVAKKLLYVHRESLKKGAKS